MKSLPLIVFLLLFSIVSSAQSIGPAKVSQQVELVGIVFRLAEVPEYSHETYKEYTNAIHKHFDPYKRHRAVTLAKELNQKGAGYSYVASLAVHLSDPKDLKLTAPLSDTDLKVFGGEKRVRAFVSALGDFYKVSDFAQFWNANRERYAEAEKNFESLSKSLHPEWFATFYGTDFKGSLNIVIGMGNGINFYGPSVTFPDGSRSIYAVFAPLVEDGKPGLPADALAFTVHEFNHSFANPFIDKHAKELEPSAARLFEKVEKEMSARAYRTWKIVMYESLVRAATASYLLKFNPGLVAGTRHSDMFEQGFVWVDAFTDLLKKYEAEREKYPSLDSFFPRMTEFYEAVAKADLALFRTEFDRRSARVVKIVPATADGGEVDPGLTEIRIRFDRPLDGKGISVNLSEKKDEKFPELVGGRAAVSFADGNREFVMKVKLEANTNYAFILTGKGFQTVDYYPLRQYSVRFKTR